MSATAARTNGHARPSLDDYIDVAERIDKFSAKYPEGTLQTIAWTVETVDEQTFIVYRAAAYRTPDDPRPGHGIAWEPFPGVTPYTRNSELMNAETAAWGRAIVACGLTSNRKIASLQEVRDRRNGNGAEPPPDRTQTEPRPNQPLAEAPKPSGRPASAKQREQILAAVREAEFTHEEFANVLKVAGGAETVIWNDGAAERWSKRALDRLPAKLVATVLDAIAEANS